MTEEVGSLAQRLLSHIGAASYAKSSKLGLPNAEANRPYFGKTIADLPAPAEPSGSAIVIVGGPSLHRRKPAQKIAASGFRGVVITSDGSLGYCLRNGLVPDYVVTVDGHPHRIVRWYGDPDLEARPPDDYFGRQDLDPEMWKDQVKLNRELIELVDRHGPRIKALLSTSTPPAVTRRCLGAGMDIYWWNPIYDDYQAAESITRSLFTSNRIPCLVTGGNVGTCAWVLAHAVLRRRRVALCGMDLGYAPGTPLLSTQYYYELKDLLKDRVAEAYIRIHNPALGETWFTDPTYYWYRQNFLELAAESDCETFNCTEGGTLFGPGIVWMPLDEFLRRFES